MAIATYDSRRLPARIGISRHGRLSLTGRSHCIWEHELLSEHTLMKRLRRRLTGSVWSEGLE